MAQFKIGDIIIKKNKRNVILQIMDIKHMPLNDIYVVKCLTSYLSDYNGLRNINDEWEISTQILDLFYQIHLKIDPRPEWY